MSIILGRCALLIALVMPTAAVADPKTGDRIDKGDQTRIVCRTESVTGSRLGSRKRCLSAAQWNEITLADRQSVERTQNQRYSGNESLGATIQGDFGRNH